MKAQRVYIDTSVLGGCFDPEFARWSNALMADFRRGRLKPVISEIITAEIADAPPEVRALLADLLALTLETLIITPEVSPGQDAESGRWQTWPPPGNARGATAAPVRPPTWGAEVAESDRRITAAPG